MGRMYIVNHWSDAAAYSGEQIGDRLKDSTALHFNRDGSANVELYSEETALAKKKTSIPLKQRILPQAARVEKLNADILELEQAYKAGEFSAEDYTLLRDVAFKKRNRAEELLKKAVSTKPTQPDEDDVDLYSEMPEDEVVYDVKSDVSHSPSAPVASDIGVRFIDELSPTNSLKGVLKMSCKLIRKAVQFKHKAAAYYQTLKEV